LERGGRGEGKLGMRHYYMERGGVVVTVAVAVIVIVTGTRAVDCRSQ